MDTAKFLRIGLCVLLTAGTVLGLAGIDLVLPAVPDLPNALGGTSSSAQLVLALFTAGTACGLLMFGWLAQHMRRRHLLVLAMLAFAGLSFAIAATETMTSMLALRFVQGMAASAPAVFAPGIIRGLFDEKGATKAFGLFSSVESLTPAFAPLLGVWLLSLGGWYLSFEVSGAMAVVLACCLLLAGKYIPERKRGGRPGSYGMLLLSPVYLRYAISQALVLGGLLIFVFAMPTVITRTMGGTITDFIIMQLTGITFFIIAANISGPAVSRFGAEAVILLGTAMAALAALGLLGYAVIDGSNPVVIAVLFAPMNLGLGLRAPPGMLRTIIAGQGDDDRAASLMVLAITGITAAGTAVFAPFIGYGLVPLCILVGVVQMMAVLTLIALPQLAKAGEEQVEGA